MLGKRALRSGAPPRCVRHARGAVSSSCGVASAQTRRYTAHTGVLRQILPRCLASRQSGFSNLASTQNWNAKVG
jgi:hypothetical protein